MDARCSDTISMDELSSALQEAPRGVKTTLMDRSCFSGATTLLAAEGRAFENVCVMSASSQTADASWDMPSWGGALQDPNITSPKDLSLTLQPALLSAFPQRLHQRIYNSDCSGGMHLRSLLQFAANPLFPEEGRASPFSDSELDLALGELRDMGRTMGSASGFRRRYEQAARRYRDEALSPDEPPESASEAVAAIGTLARDIKARYEGRRGYSSQARRLNLLLSIFEDAACSARRSGPCSRISF